MEGMARTGKVMVTTRKRIRSCIFIEYIILAYIERDNLTF